MNVVYQIFQKYFTEEKWSIVGIVLLSFGINYAQTNLISQITASLIDAVEHSQVAKIMQAFSYFIYASIGYLALYFTGEVLEMRMLTKLAQWMKQEFLRFIIYSNNESFNTVNAIKYSSPMNRVSFMAYNIISSFINHILTNVAFILVIAGYFFYKSPALGAGFLVSNIAIMVYIFMIWTPLMDLKNTYEKSANDNESLVIDVLNNFDKIIYRGQAKETIDDYSKRTQTCVDTARDFYEKVHAHIAVLYTIIYGTIMVILYYLIMMTISKDIDTKTFIAFMTILLIYRDKLTSIVQLLPNFLEFNGRMDFAIKNMEDLVGDYESIGKTVYKPTDLKFEKIEFKDVYFRYKRTDEYMFKNLNLKIESSHNIVGITGLSGRGKSTLMKLLLKMHSCEKGSILVDGVDIKTIDPMYIRKKVVYVNQSSKLFDRKIVENMMYGCKDTDVCKKYLDIVLSHPKISGLYKNLDINTGMAGPLGEKLSGGQRQIANIISGLVNESEILILDEPTNALDGELKKELLGLIDEFRQYKKCIVIITHDRDVYPLMDERINI
jgi:ABC-type bacteriocin/lantibiotic exporter with double-glycine peptidase domain